MSLDLFLVAGQSNAVGRGNAAESPTAAHGIEYVARTGSIVEGIADPVAGGFRGKRWDRADTGSAWPAFANEYTERTERKIALVSSAVGATTQTRRAQDVTGAVENWSARGDLYPNSVRYTREAIVALESVGYDVVFRGVLWHQGETDAKALSTDRGRSRVGRFLSIPLESVANYVPTANDSNRAHNAIGRGAENDRDYLIDKYRSALEAMLSRYRSAFSTTLPFWMFELGSRDGYRWESEHEQIREAQRTVAAADEHTHVISTVQKRFVAEGKMSDDVHYSQEGYNEMGRAGAQTIASRIDR